MIHSKAQFYLGTKQVPILINESLNRSLKELVKKCWLIQEPNKSSMTNESNAERNNSLTTRNGSIVTLFWNISIGGAKLHKVTGNIVFKL